MPDLLYDVTEHTATITLNRPDRLNAITFEMLESLSRVLRQAADDPQVRVIVLTGAGRGFCSGLDLKQAAEGKGIGGALASGGVVHTDTRDLPTVILQQLDTPVVCAINGAAAGYGLDLALGCDVRLMNADARLIPGFAKRAIVPESGGTWYLPRLVGWARACEISFLGDDVPAERALALGLVNAVVPDALAEAQRWAAKIAGNAPLAIKAMKRLFRHGLTEDFREGVASFVERRPPRFEGR